MVLKVPIKIIRTLGDTHCFVNLNINLLVRCRSSTLLEFLSFDLSCSYRVGINHKLRNEREEGPNVIGLSNLGLCIVLLACSQKK